MHTNHSTGPTSETGKHIASRNALKHGSCSTATLILNHESMEDFLALEARWFHGYNINPDNPDTQHEAELIRTAARADWFYQRADRNYSEIEAQIMNHWPDLIQWSNEQHQMLARFQRYRTTNSNLLAKQRKAIEDYRKNRTAEAARAQAAEHKQERVAMSKEKPAIYQEKNKPHPTCNEGIQIMLPQATSLVDDLNPDGPSTGEI